MSEQLALFDGFRARIRNWVPVELTHRQGSLYEHFLNQIEIDFEKLPSIPDMQAAYLEKRPITLTGMEGGTMKFHVLTDLGYEGWPDDPTIEAPSYIFYEGILNDRETVSQSFRDNPSGLNCWLLLVEPGGNIDGSDTWHFGPFDSQSESGP